MSNSQDREATAGLPIIQYWDADVVPRDISALFATFDTHNGTRPHLLFSEATALVLIAEHFSQRELGAFRVCAVPAMQADYFRYCALYVHGGLWFDADCYCRADLSSMLRPGSARLFEGPDGALKNWVLAFGSTRHPLLRLIIAFATTNIEHGLFDKVWIATGPAILGALVDVWRLGSSDLLFDTVERSVHAKSPREVRLRESYLESLREIVGDGSPVSEAFESVDVESVGKMSGLVRHGSSHLLYKRTKAHYPNFTSSIYRK